VHVGDGALPGCRRGHGNLEEIGQLGEVHQAREACTPLPAMITGFVAAAASAAATRATSTAAGRI
jgi:hypothetical protein